MKNYSYSGYRFQTQSPAEFVSFLTGLVADATPWLEKLLKENPDLDIERDILLKDAAQRINKLFDGGSDV